ncbi:hypothetical protein MED121_01535 [Marinomonas sp. MED121]|nr:hypothetical protein MED121_01535 [Marinomonas sp. MED121]
MSVRFDLIALKKAFLKTKKQLYGYKAAF